MIMSHDDSILSSPRGAQRRLAGWLAVACALFFAVAARAQTVRWQAAESSLAIAVELVFEGCSPEGQPDLPTLPGATIQFVGRSESMNLIDFQMRRTVTLSYLIRARQNAPVQIPEFTVRTDQGPIRVPAFTAAAPAVSLDSVASSKLIPSSTRVWAGEVFELTYELQASRHNNPQISSSFDWNSAPLVAEEWSKPELTEGVVGNERRVQVVFRTRASAKTPNTIRLEPTSHLLSIQTGTIGFGIISQPRMEQVAVTSDQPVLEIRPLPPAPAGFGGAVGQFKLVSKVVPEKAAVGEPITWTLELSGTGNWPDLAGLPERDVSNDFQVVQPRARRTPAEGKLFDVTLTEDVVLVPTKAGSYTLGPVDVVYFDPQSGTYRTLTAPRTTVAIAAPGAALFTPPSETETAAPGLMPESAPGPATPAPTAAIPRDPLPGSAQVMTPLSQGALVSWVLAPFGGLLLFWFGLALRHARKTDPLRPRREAHAHLAATLARLATAKESEQTALLLAWQRDAARLWQIRDAAPSAAAFSGRALPSARSSAVTAEGAPPSPEAALWAQLWLECERTLYGVRSPLPPDWVTRAQAALHALRLPGFRPTRLFLPQNLMPFAALLALMPVLAAAGFAAASVEPAAAYRQGNFAAAETSWRAALAQAPTDWIARHNLSLALAQQDRTGEAAAQAAAAFVQRPSHPSVRWHLALAAEKANFVPEALAPFLRPGALHALARLASPAVWQVLLILAAFGGAAALGWKLFNAYGSGRRAVYTRAAAAFTLCLILGGTAIVAESHYGMAADARVVVVSRGGLLRSIPTEADTAQKTSTLAAGSMALADRTFLGWTHLVFSNDQTGWVRNEEIVPLWR